MGCVTSRCYAVLPGVLGCSDLSTCSFVVSGLMLARPHAFKRSESKCYTFEMQKQDGTCLKIDAVLSQSAVFVCLILGHLPCAPPPPDALDRKLIVACGDFRACCKHVNQIAVACLALSLSRICFWRSFVKRKLGAIAFAVAVGRHCCIHVHFEHTTFLVKSTIWFQHE